ncbi:MAG: C4-dicarboxylate transporter DcuC [Methylobacteriaceae bacterium]|jgi:DcuC family C4-dicarboxylate transporter|nr:C4-dicarboxylate transporter DcuC [Methylobacteriaceae bacterium]
MLGFAIGIIVTVIAAYFIIKNYQPQTVLLLAGLVLLALTAVLFPDTPILYGKTKSIGATGFDIFNFAKESLTAQVAGIGLIIMAAGGFADYMDHIKASNSMVNLCVKPLQLIKAPYVILAAGYILGQILHVAISSAAGLAMLLLVTFFPILVRLGVSKAAAAAMIGMTAFMDLGPAVGTANLAAKHAGIETAVYFVENQLPVAVGVMLVVAVLIYFTAQHFDKVDGHVVAQTEADEATKAEENSAPGFYALLPVIPIAIVLVFSPLVIDSIKMHVVTAMIMGALIGLLCELLVKRDVKGAFKGFQVFFSGMGKMFTSIVSLLVCADVFASGFQIIGAVDFIVNSVQNAGLGANVMTVVMTLLVGVTAAITGSGVAAFSVFSQLAPNIASSFGASSISMILPMQLMAGMGRAISPVAGVIIAVSKSGECSSFQIVRRTLIPALGGMVTMLILNFLVN